MKIAYLLRTIVEMICQIWKIFPIAFVSVRRRYFYVHLCNLYKTRTNFLIIEMIRNFNLTFLYKNIGNKQH